MIQKIRYRLVYNKAHRLNKRGEGLIQIECQQGNRCRYVSTNTYVKPENWNGSVIIGTLNDYDRNYVLFLQVAQVEQIELEFIKRGIDVNLPMLIEAVQTNVAPSAKLRDFGMQMIQNGERKELTKRNYITLFNDIDKFRPNVLLTDIDYNWINAYDKHLHEIGVAHNTRVGRMRQLRAIMNEAKKRDFIHKDPFERFRIPSMKNKSGYITFEQLRKLEQMNLTGKQEIVRDAFLVGCYTGLRFSDIKTLRKEHFDKEWINKLMIKTQTIVNIPYTKLFDNKLSRIIEKYGNDIGNLTRQIGGNGETNRILRYALNKVKAERNITFHSSRHTFASLLGQKGVDLPTIQKLLGHKKITTTEIYREINKKTIINGITKKKK